MAVGQYVVHFCLFNISLSTFHVSFDHYSYRLISSCMSGYNWIIIFTTPVLGCCQQSSVLSFLSYIILLLCTLHSIPCLHTPMICILQSMTEDFLQSNGPGHSNYHEVELIGNLMIDCWAARTTYIYIYTRFLQNKLRCPCC